MGGKLPELLELSVRVHNCRDVVYRVINRNSEIVGHLRFSFVRLSREVFQCFVGVGKSCFLGKESVCIKTIEKRG